ncbi:hypothetical protein SEA_MAGICMAN_7 [Gordonia phage MagicMan]|uniref:Head-to-tail connector protein n=1 Tax=Gordonia phage Schnabeltier TaxID=1821561 RepID=A0A142K9Z5_9CAUD|nr:head-tail connector protein [Gordonia phage Schnabeltier]AMS02928.1 hypothetical protein SEA_SCHNABELTIER_7 [Gordonia phage Schnabeltier]QDM55824.1 hypothetical protein SEA_MAGICMAN_7 [Gordonia phage MagicMan]
MAKKTIRVATWEYRDKAKKRRRAYYGDVVDLSAAEVKRGDAAGVFGAFDEVADQQPVAPEPALVADTGTSALPAAPDTDTADDDLAGLGDGDDDDQGPTDADDTTPAETEGGTDDSGAEAPQLSRPRNTAPHEDWVEYAVSTGLDRTEAAAMERAELIKALS